MLSFGSLGAQRVGFNTGSLYCFLPDKKAQPKLADAFAKNLEGNGIPAEVFDAALVGDSGRYHYTVTGPLALEYRALKKTLDDPANPELSKRRIETVNHDLANHVAPTFTIYT